MVNFSLRTASLGPIRRALERLIRDIDGEYLSDKFVPDFETVIIDSAIFYKPRAPRDLLEVLKSNVPSNPREAALFWAKGAIEGRMISLNYTPLDSASRIIIAEPYDPVIAPGGYYWLYGVDRADSHIKKFRSDRLSSMFFTGSTFTPTEPSPNAESLYETYDLSGTVEVYEFSGFRSFNLQRLIEGIVAPGELPEDPEAAAKWMGFASIEDYMRAEEEAESDRRDPRDVFRTDYAELVKTPTVDGFVRNPAVMVGAWENFVRTSPWTIFAELDDLVLPILEASEF